MSKFVAFSVAALLVCSASAFADVQQGPAFGQPVPAVGQTANYQPTPPMAPPALTPIPEQGVIIGGGPVYQNVRYRAVRNIAPCAVPMIVSVQDPCYCADPCNACAGPKCVNVEICVPQCPCPPKVCTSKCGTQTTYDFGKYAVNITSRKGVVTVSYRD